MPWQVPCGFLSEVGRTLACDVGPIGSVLSAAGAVSGAGPGERMEASVLSQGPLHSLMFLSLSRALLQATGAAVPFYKGKHSCQGPPAGF